MASGEQNLRTNVRSTNLLENIQTTETVNENERRNSSHSANVQVTDKHRDKTQRNGHQAREENSIGNSASHSLDSEPMQRYSSYQIAEAISQDNKRTLCGTVVGSSTEKVYSRRNKLEGMANGGGSSQIKCIPQAAGHGRQSHEDFSAYEAVSETNLSDGGAKYPKDRTVAARQSSFAKWPMKQTPKQMAEAGFFFVGNPDRCMCFTCGIGLRDWEADDDPVAEHIKHNPNCEFITTLQREFPKEQMLYTHREVETQARCASDAEVSSNFGNRPPSCSRGSESYVVGDEDDVQPLSVGLGTIGATGFDASQQFVSKEIIKSQSYSVNNKHIERTVNNQRICVPENAQDQYGIGVKKPTYFTSDDRVVIQTSSTRCLCEKVISLTRERELRRLRQENCRLRNQILCTKCRRTKRSVIFLPCLHFVCCKGCARNTCNCPACNNIIYSRLSTYGNES